RDPGHPEGRAARCPRLVAPASHPSSGSSRCREPSQHIKALEAAGARTRLVRSREDLDGLDGIVLPGGESTTMTMLMERVGMLAPLRQAIERGLPTLATCAGMIVLAREITDGMADQKGLDLLDIA